MVYKYLALDKWTLLIKIIVKNGGPFKSIMKIWKQDTLKDGILRGTDCYGNKYYENNYYIIGRNRWVEYNPLFKFEYDGSQVTAEWFGWLHHRTDRIPSEDCAKYCLMSCCYVHNWLQPHQENFTATNKSFYPYSTVKSYITVWDVDNAINGHESLYEDVVSQKEVAELLREEDGAAVSMRQKNVGSRHVAYDAACRVSSRGRMVDSGISSLGGLKVKLRV